ncbi:methyltransferase-domain-containing protein [Trametes punicea]|nr:methyltransferase-domain-containing protein [Trametes punicea]
MSLFEVPGWSVPPAPVPQPSKKRKRPAAQDVDDVDEAERIKAAQKNIEKLMRALGAGTADLEGDDAIKQRKKSRSAKEKKGKRSAVEPEEGRKMEKDGKKGGEARAASRETKAANSTETSRAEKRSREKPERSPRRAETKQERKEKQKHKEKSRRSQSADARSESDSTHRNVHGPPSVTEKTEQRPSRKTNDGPGDAGKSQGLTPLQANMKKSLDGARFRWINEMLYKSDSAKARELMSSDPAVFADYHTGFRHQVESWPTNPVSHYISTLSSYPAKTVIADLGCGDAALARALIPKGMTVLSFDLVSDGAYVIEADICTRIPLPGSEASASSSKGDSDNATAQAGEGQVVDVVVCALSLMGTNWPGCIREAWRILKVGGELKVAEVASRFSNVDEFTSFICAFGFKLKSKDDRNNYFTLLEFKKVPRKRKEIQWKNLMSRGNLLKPCEYKRR